MELVGIHGCFSVDQYLLGPWFSRMRDLTGMLSFLHKIRLTHMLGYSALRPVSLQLSQRRHAISQERTQLMPLMYLQLPPTTVSQQHRRPQICMNSRKSSSANATAR